MCGLIEPHFQHLITSSTDIREVCHRPICAFCRSLGSIISNSGIELSRVSCAGNDTIRYGIETLL